MRSFTLSELRRRIDEARQRLPAKAGSPRAQRLMDTATSKYDLPGWVVVLLYSLFSEEYYASGFYSPTPRAVEQFWLWLNDHESRPLDEYEREFIERYWKPSANRSLEPKGGR